VTNIAHQLPVESSHRAELEASTAQTTIPVLVTADGHIIRDEKAILSYLEAHYDEPPGADSRVLCEIDVQAP
jgi:glutathione S-transferase